MQYVFPIKKVTYTFENRAVMVSFKQVGLQIHTQLQIQIYGSSNLGPPWIQKVTSSQVAVTCAAVVHKKAKHMGLKKNNVKLSEPIHKPKVT